MMAIAVDITEQAASFPPTTSPSVIPTVVEESEPLPYLSFRPKWRTILSAAKSVLSTK
ncbi:MAG: hypothetical protein H6601_02345 [Flavobacteriales bacterium]|nr:hypothetical protein [Flavobacteriales bacterium]